MTGVIIDICLVVILLVFMAVGYFKGFLRSIVSLLGTVGSGVVAYLIKDYIANMFDAWFGWGAKIANLIASQVNGISATFSTEQGSTAEELLTIINNSDAGVIYKKLFSLMVNSFKFSEPVTVSSVVGTVVSSIALALIAMIIIFVVLKVLVCVLDKIFKKIPRQSVVGTANGVLGLFVGMAKGLIFVGAALVIVYFLNMIPNINSALYPYIESTYITKYFYEFVGKFLLWFFWKYGIWNGNKCAWMQFDYSKYKEKMFEKTRVFFAYIFFCAILV